MEFDSAVISVIYTCTPKELVIPFYIRERFKFLFSNSQFLQTVKRAKEEKERRVVGFIKNIGLLRVGVKEQWHQIILSFESISKRYCILVPPLVPLYAVSKKQFYVKVMDEEGEKQKYPGKVIVSIYPLFTFAIRLVFKVDNKVTANWLINLLKEQELKIKITYKGQTYSRFIDFASYVKLWTLLSLFNTEYVRKVNEKLSKQSYVVYLKGNTILRNVRPVVGLALGIKNYEILSTSVTSRYTKYMPRLYRGDVMISSEQGFVVYSPYLTRNGSELQRKRFRRNVFLATEIAYVTKRYLKASTEILKTAIRENTEIISDMVIRSFVMANPFALGKYKFTMGLLKPHTLQKFYKSIMFKLKLLGSYSATIEAHRVILANILTPELVDLYARINSLALPIVTNTVRELFFESRTLKIPELLKQLEDIFHEKFKEIAVATVNYLIEEFKKDYLSWTPERRDENALGWRKISKICEALNQKISNNKLPSLENKRINKDVFYKHSSKGYPGIIPLLELYGIIKVEEVSSPGRSGKAKKVRINPDYPPVKYILEMSNVEK